MSPTKRSWQQRQQRWFQWSSCLAVHTIVCRSSLSRSQRIGIFCGARYSCPESYGLWFGLGQIGFTDRTGLTNRIQFRVTSHHGVLIGGKGLVAILWRSCRVVSQRLRARFMLTTNSPAFHTSDRESTTASNAETWLLASSSPNWLKKESTRGAGSRSFATSSHCTNARSV